MDRPESASVMFMPPEIHDKDYMCWGGKILVGKCSVLLFCNDERSCYS